MGLENGLFTIIISTAISAFFVVDSVF